MRRLAVCLVLALAAGAALLPSALAAGREYRTTITLEVTEHKVEGKLSSAKAACVGGRSFQLEIQVSGAPPSKPLGGKTLGSGRYGFRTTIDEGTVGRVLVRFPEKQVGGYTCGFVQREFPFQL